MKHLKMSLFACTGANMDAKIWTDFEQKEKQKGELTRKSLETPHEVFSHQSDIHQDPELLEQLPAPSAQPSQLNGHEIIRSRPSWVERLSEVNKELWLILSLLLIAAVMNYLITGHHMLLGLYTLPALFSAYFYGRRHATLTACASIFLVGVLAYFNEDIFSALPAMQLVDGRWYDIMAWGGILVITAYAMGTLHEKHAARMQELRRTYHSVLLLLRQFISKDKYTENHCYRVSIYATKIAARLRLSSNQIEDIRTASLLHDIGKLDTSRELLYKAAALTREERGRIEEHADKGGNILEPTGGSLGRIIPIVLAHHDRFDGSGYHPTAGEQIPLEARVISIADVYDALTSDRPYRKAMSPFEAKDIIVKGSGKDFDPKVVNAFLEVFNRGNMEVPEVVL
jgi:putative nucleotidyltransferase with HDIG domain